MEEYEIGSLEIRAGFADGLDIEDEGKKESKMASRKLGVVIHAYNSSA